MNFSEVIISKQNLLHNLRQFKKITEPSKIISVVKSNAYGHDVDLVSKVIEKETDWFATVNLNEALHLRKIGIKKPILVLSYYDLDSVSEAIVKNISLVIYDLKQTQAIDRAAKRLKKLAKIHIKIDTGTSRLGVIQGELKKFAESLKNFPNLEIEGVFSHLASSEENTEYTQRQLAEFEMAIKALSKEGIKPKIKHIACTAAALSLKNSHYNAVRLGIGLYGLWPSDTAHKQALKLFPKLALKPVLSWKARIIQIKDLGVGTFVGYGNTFRVNRKTKLAVLPVGYHEGYDRALSNNAQVLIRNKKCKVLGRICMNLMMVDITGTKAVVGDEAVLIGKMGKEIISAEDLAKNRTINYEIVARISSLIPRILK